VSKPYTYSLAGYGEMITCHPRMEAYAQALRQAVRPGCVVLDIGAGTGIFSLLACQFGAGHVHAVEPDNAIQVAKDMARANGFADRITFHQTLSTAITLPQPADVVICDLRGILPLFQHHLPAVIDARQRLMAPGGVLIPRRDRLWAAVVEDPSRYQPYVEPWLTNAYGLDLSAGHPLMVNTWRKANARPEQLLVRPQQWATLNYPSIEQTDVTGELGWEAERAGTAHGLLVWFDAELGDNVGFSNAPDMPELIYGQAFFPFQEPVSLEQGDRIEVKLRANLVGSDYVWSWNSKVAPSGSAGRLKADFSQSTFYGTPLAPTQLSQHEAGFVPQLTQQAEIDRLCLTLINGATPLGDIARQVASQFPERFTRWQDALSFVAELWERYSPPPA
jgi:protein arginine N-methyltransferase 1